MFLKFKKKIAVLSVIMLSAGMANAQSKSGWYTEGKDYAPTRRIKINVTNPLAIPVKGAPVVVQRKSLPFQNIPERWIGVVDPSLPSDPEPTAEELKKNSGYVRRKETNGHYVELQVDDKDKDGIWDEIFFMTDLKARESRDFYIYIDHYERGMYEHEVHAAIANYGRHTVPLWESKDMGWKLWYPHDVDLHGKRAPMLTAYYEYSTNKSGYYMPWEMGTDIMTVATTFGAGGMAVFENPNDMENPSRAYHSPFKNKGPFDDTRYTFDVVYNGPLRSMIKVTTTNWNSGKGFYELDQYYTAMAGKSWSIVETKFNKFLPPNADVNFGAGIRKIMNEYTSVNKKGIAISMGKDVEARIPDEDIGEEVLRVPWQGIGLVVRDKYKPEYKSIKNFGGNHVFKMPVTADLSYEYMILGAWSFGEVNNNEKDFVKYVEDESVKYNNPPVIKVSEFETKAK
ncbi:protein of unknown function [Daejeonella rubra]|uniref:DUF4861 domain-containing protein n=1 Tax=Daejeonella rubra TaxID=990371 RepID=A0A1G9Y1N8_9SPHI|nr:DUF4861 family protein [Daejeonella rubra]SDN02586.1 protein of unknown function [Daejeonella rubra]